MRGVGAQLLGVAKGLSRYAKFSSVGVLGGSSMAAQVSSKKKKTHAKFSSLGVLGGSSMAAHVSY